MSTFLMFSIFSVLILFFFCLILWRINTRKYVSSEPVASAYDSWTQDKLLERLWGEHIHLGFYPPNKNIDFREAKVNLLRACYWSGLEHLPRGSRVLDVGWNRRKF